MLTYRAGCDKIGAYNLNERKKVMAEIKKNLGEFVEAYEPTPSSRKSFYGKCIVEQWTGGKVLRSYGTAVAVKVDGVVYNTWGGWSATTGRHIAEVFGLNKRAYQSCERADLWHGTLTIEG